MSTAPLTILHVDMDAFYASVEQRDRPELRGRPVIVGGLRGRGVVCAASYEARPFGVHSAMPISQARRLCPHAIFLPVRMDRYVQVSQQIRAVFDSVTPLVEPLSLDEAFLDVRGCDGLFGDAGQIARRVKNIIKSDVGLAASVAVAPNKFLAKLASDLCKPDGLFILPRDKVTDFLAPLPVSRLWGVGAKGEKRLEALGIQTIGHLAAWPPRALVEHFGDTGRHLWELAHGRDDRAVVPDRQANSISTETTFAQDIGEPHSLRVWLLDLADHVASRLRHADLHARTIDLKIRSSDFRTRTFSRSLEPTNITEVIWKTGAELLQRALSEDVLPVRLLGIGASKLSRDAALQPELFDEGRQKRYSALDKTVDAIREQFGESAIQRAGLRDIKEPRTT